MGIQKGASDCSLLQKPNPSTVPPPGIDARIVSRASLFAPPKLVAEQEGDQGVCRDDPLYRRQGEAGTASPSTFFSPRAPLGSPDFKGKPEN